MQCDMHWRGRRLVLVKQVCGEEVGVCGDEVGVCSDVVRGVY